MANSISNPAVEMVALAEAAKQLCKEINSNLKETKKLGKRKFIPQKPSDDDRVELNNLDKITKRLVSQLNETIVKVSEKAAILWG
jgi:hypothetical protein